MWEFLSNMGSESYIPLLFFFEVCKLFFLNRAFSNCWNVHRIFAKHETDICNIFIFPYILIIQTFLDTDYYDDIWSKPNITYYILDSKLNLKNELEKVVGLILTDLKEMLVVIAMEYKWTHLRTCITVYSKACILEGVNQQLDANELSKGCNTQVQPTRSKNSLQPLPVKPSCNRRNGQ